MFLNAVQAESILSLAVSPLWAVSCDAFCFRQEIFLSFFCSLQCGQYEAMWLFYALLYLLLRIAFGYAVVIPTSLITGDFSFYFSACYSKKAQKFNVSLHALVNDLVNFSLVPPRFHRLIWVYQTHLTTAPHPSPPGGMLALNRCTLLLKFTSLSCELNDPRDVTRRIVLSTNNYSEKKHKQRSWTTYNKWKRVKRKRNCKREKWKGKADLYTSSCLGYLL